jgi:hypothetical protein
LSSNMRLVIGDEYGSHYSKICLRLIIINFFIFWLKNKTFDFWCSCSLNIKYVIKFHSQINGFVLEITYMEVITAKMSNRSWC